MSKPIINDRPQQVICGYRETRTDGTVECVRPVGCLGPHYLIRLVQTVREAS